MFDTVMRCIVLDTIHFVVIVVVVVAAVVFGIL